MKLKLQLEQFPLVNVGVIDGDRSPFVDRQPLHVDDLLQPTNFANPMYDTLFNDGTSTLAPSADEQNKLLAGDAANRYSDDVTTLPNEPLLDNPFA